MLSIFHDAQVSDDRRRELIYDGQIFMISPNKATIALCDFAQELIEEAFAGRDPRTAQYEMPVEDFVAIVAPLQPRFIHHPKTKDLIVDVLDRGRLRPGEDLLRRAAPARHLPAPATSRPASPTRCIRTATPGTRRRPASSTGGCRSSTSSRTARMAFHPAYWDRACATARATSTTTSGTARGARTPRSEIKADTRKQPKRGRRN